MADRDGQRLVAHGWFATYGAALTVGAVAASTSFFVHWHVFVEPLETAPLAAWAFTIGVAFVVGLPSAMLWTFFVSRKGAPRTWRSLPVYASLGALCAAPISGLFGFLWITVAWAAFSGFFGGIIGWWHARRRYVRLTRHLR